MLKNFINQLEERREKESALIKKAADELQRRVEFNKELKEEFDAIGQEAPGFSNEDAAI